VIICHSREIEKYIIVTIIIGTITLYIYIYINIIGDRAGLYLELDGTWLGNPSEALIVFVPPVSIEDCPLLWTLVRS
jgi:hypothetical protein